MKIRIAPITLMMTLGLLASMSCDRSEPEPTAQAADEGEWCEGHGVAESHCIKCHPKLREKFKAMGDYCEEHDFPASVCPECKIRKPAGAEAAQAAGAAAPASAGQPAVASVSDWCAEHALPESMCTKCNPKLAETYKAAGDWCAEHGYPESVCPLCNPMKPPGGVSEGAGLQPGTKIRFKSPGIARAAGIEVVLARESKLGLEIEAPAEIAFDRNRLAEVGAPLPGTIREVLVDLGTVVKQGQPLFVIESARAGDLQAQVRGAKERLRLTEADFTRQESLLRSKISSASAVEASKKELESARADLAALESAISIAGGGARGGPGRYTVNAPIAGTVVARPAVRGKYVTELDPLATVADIGRLWALVHVREWEASTLKLGLPVTLSVDGAAGRTFEGEITWIAAAVDPKTRNVEVRVEIPNTDGVLKANQYARAAIRLAEPKPTIAVPREAIQRFGEESVLFVKTGDGVYEPRIARLGRSGGGAVQVLENLAAGEEVVTTGAFLLRTELSKDSIGAGCCEVDEPAAVARK
jgi:membrane fusion protein, heavy metal efflux system